MLNVITTGTDPYFNMAMEEYFFKYTELQDDLLILWQNSPTVVVGKYQNTIEEIHYDFLKAHGIKVVRRLTGGGAVYHDVGNLNFTCIMNNYPMPQFDFSTFAKPVIATLAQLGIHAESTGRNDITIDGKKFSGNAEHFSHNRLLHHGTLLFNSDFSLLSKILNVKEKKYTSKGVKSVASRVTNISDYLTNKISITEFRKMLAQNFFQSANEPYQEYHPTKNDLVKINELRENRYSTWEWNFGLSPEYNFKQEKTFAGGTVSLYLEVKNGIIQMCKIFGDFFSSEDIAGLENIVTGEKYEEFHLRGLLNHLDISRYIFNVTAEELLSCFFAN